MNCMQQSRTKPPTPLRVLITIAFSCFHTSFGILYIMTNLRGFVCHQLLKSGKFNALTEIVRLNLCLRLYSAQTTNVYSVAAFPVNNEHYSGLSRCERFLRYRSIIAITFSRRIFFEEFITLMDIQQRCCSKLDNPNSIGKTNTVHIHS